jgi:hypothetical protein
MMQRRGPFAAVTVATSLLAACSPPAGTGAAPAASASAAASSAAEAWVGRWNGPEGSYLEIVQRGHGAYEVTLNDLDEPKTYAATASADRLSFERDGVREAIRATDGAGTGMKWLDGKTRCLVVKPGEGFCRE